MGTLGNHLRRERELRQLSVAEIAQTTRIPVRILKQLENDQHDDLPADVFVRGYLKAYARVLGIDEGYLLERYGADHQLQEEAPTPLPAVYAPEPGRRFGIAIALVILLILFTLALSIVLRPRRRDTPVELSQRSVPCQVEASSPMLSCSAVSTSAKPTASSRC